METDTIVLNADGNVYKVFSSSRGSDCMCTSTQHAFYDISSSTVYCITTISGRYGSEVYVEVHEWDYFNHVLELQDDVGSSWKEGDEVVVASTDYDTEQAEVFTILSVDGSTITVNGKYFTMVPV